MNKSKSIILITVILVFITGNFAYGQDKKEKIGSDEIVKEGINYYNYADKDKVNIEVGVWGYVKSPGKYLIPSGTTFVDLISLCGGPLAEAKLGDVRIIRMKNDSLNIKEDKIIILNYNDFLWEDKIQNVSRQNPVLIPGDIILIPGSQKSLFRENIGLILGAITTLSSVAVLLITVLRK